MAIGCAVPLGVERRGSGSVSGGDAHPHSADSVRRCKATVPDRSDDRALRGGQAQPGGVERQHDLSAGDDEGALLDGNRACLVGDVVVVTLECPSRCADPLGKGMELVEGVVAHEMAPQASAPVPVRFIEEESHSPRLALAAHPAQGSEVCPDGDIDPEQQREDEHDACGDGRIDERADVGV